MTINPANIKYVPGMYAKKRPSASQMANNYIRDWQTRHTKKGHTPAQRQPAICLSRKIGVGALELADLLSERLGYRVADREIIEHIANKADLSEPTVAYYDERYADKVDELMSFMFREKAFVMSDYARNLVSAIYSLADSAPTIFVGRGAHLVLPRESVLAVRLICAKSYRVARLARMLQIEPEFAAKELDQADQLQRNFFKKVYNAKDASPYEFDMVINLDHLPELSCAADIVHTAFKCKFENVPGK
jgi:cytidylate kinase